MKKAELNNLKGKLSRMTDKELNIKFKLAVELLKNESPAAFDIVNHMTNTRCSTDIDKITYENYESLNSIVISNVILPYMKRLIMNM